MDYKWGNDTKFLWVFVFIFTLHISLNPSSNLFDIYFTENSSTLFGTSWGHFICHFKRLALASIRSECLLLSYLLKWHSPGFSGRKFVLDTHFAPFPCSRDHWRRTCVRRWRAPGRFPERSQLVCHTNESLRLRNWALELHVNNQPACSVRSRGDVGLVL